MYIVLTIFALIVWAVIQFKAEKLARDAGEPLLTRKQLRYMRRKARRTGTTISTVEYKSHPGNRAYPIFHKDWLGPDGKLLLREQTLPPDGPTRESTKSWGWFILACVIAAIVYVAAKSQQQALLPLAAPAPAIADTAVPQAATSSHPSGIRGGRTKQGANVRAGPSGSAAVLRTVAANTNIRIIEVSGGWMQVSIGDAPPIGWVHGSLID